MTEHAHRPAPERHCDVAVVGGSAAGLGAALQLGRQRRSVIVVDAGEPRNAPAAHMHSYLGHEGLPPAELLAIARAEVRSYGVEVLPDRAVDVIRTDDGRFRVELASGRAVLARRVLAATGLVDELPEIDGLRAHWGGDVIHCPFCHGFEVRDRRIVQIVTHPRGLHPAALFRQLSAQLTLVLHGDIDEGDEQLLALRRAGVAVEQGPVRRIVDADDGHLAAVELADGRHIDADAVVVTTRFAVRAEAFASLGLKPKPHPTGLGDVIETDEMGMTEVAGVYAAGNVTDPSQQVLPAAADGSRVGGMISFSLAHEDVEAAARPSAIEHEWDRRYAGDRTWSGNPNGTLIHEVAGLAPGRALDVGAGEGGDARWLAQQGWRVTASDVSRRALDHVAAVADEHAVAVECCQADANALHPFDTAAYDLVSAQYVPIPRTPDDRGVRNVLGAVTPGGTLLVVNHAIDPEQHQPFFDLDAFAQIDDFVRVLDEDPGWSIEVHEQRPRPGGHASHHVEDVVLRARRR